MGEFLLYFFPEKLLSGEASSAFPGNGKNIFKTISLLVVESQIHVTSYERADAFGDHALFAELYLSFTPFKDKIITNSKLKVVHFTKLVNV